MSQNQGFLGATIVNKLIAIRIEALEPYPLTMKGGVLPTALKARTGILAGHVGLLKKVLGNLLGSLAASYSSCNH